MDTPNSPGGHKQSKNRFVLLRILTIVVAGLAVYSSGLSGAFLFDDIQNIVHSPVVKGPILSSLQSTRPMTIASFCINYHVTGLSVLGFHCVNIAVHITASVVFYLLLVETFAKLDLGKFDRQSVAFVIALIWCVHPLNTQAVTYIVQRAESITGLFFFSFLLSIAKSDGSKHPSLWQGLAFFSLCLGLGCKQVMLMALPVGLIYDGLFLSHGKKPWFGNRRWFWLLSFTLIVLAAFIVVPNLYGSAGGVGFGLNNVNSVEYASTQPKVILYYLRLLLFPSPLILDYGWGPEKRAWVLMLTSAILVAIAVLSMVAVRRRSHWGFWPLAALLVLAPTSSVVPLVDLLVEHRMYVPGAFILAMLGLAVARVAEFYPSRYTGTLVLIASGLTVVVFGTMTLQRNQTYRSPVVMWEDVVQKAPDNWRGYFNLGCELESSAPEESQSMYEKAIELNPDFASSFSNLARILLQQGKTAESIANLRRAIELDDRFADAYINLGLAMKSLGDDQAAFQLFQRSLQLDPRSSKGHYNLGTLYAKADLEMAIKHLRTAIELDPEFSQSHNNLAALIEEQDPETAKHHYREAVRIDPTNIQAKRNLETLLGALPR